jgi:hypothetical protein
MKGPRLIKQVLRHERAKVEGYLNLAKRLGDLPGTTAAAHGTFATEHIPYTATST